MNHTYKLKLVQILLTGSILVALHACSADFMGNNGLGGGKGQRFSGGDSNPTDTGTRSGIGTGTGTDNGDNPFGNVVIGDGIDTKEYKPLLVNVVRRDCSTGNNMGSGCDGGSDDQSDVSLELRVVGAKEVLKGTLPGESSATTIERACPDNATVQIELRFVVGSSRYKPNKQLVGGPIAFRRDDKTLWIGFEKDEVGGNSTYHYNDDLVIELICENSKRIEVKDLCIDNQIPASPKATGPHGKSSGRQFSGPGSDLITDEKTNGSNDYPRKCDGT